MSLMQVACAQLFLLFCLVGAASAAQPDLMVKLASEQDSFYLGEGIFEATAVTQSRSQPAFPGTAATFRVKLKNAGNSADTFTVRGGGSGSGFSVRYLDADGIDRSAELSGAGLATRPLAPGESLSMLVEVLPAAIVPGASFRVAVSAASATEGAAVDQVKTETVACSSTAAVILSSPPDAAGPPGSVVNYAYTVTNVGSETNNFALSVSGTSGWPAVIYADDGAAGGVAGDGVRQSGENVVTAATGPLPPGASYRVFVAVTVPQGAANGARGDIRLTAAGNAASAVDDVTTTAMSATLSVAESVRNLTQGGAFTTAVNAYPGDILEYRMSITNSGSTPAMGVAVDAPLPQGVPLVTGSLWIGTSAGADGPVCAVSECGWVRENGSNLVARLGQGATDSVGGTLLPGKTLYVYYRVKVE